jgi:dsDNA-specific endonuclease/ATPase MutS2
MPPPSPTVETLSLEPQSTYPELEAFVERASTGDVDQLFNRLRDSLETLKGPRTEQAKKAKVALERTEELLGRLLELRENLAELRKKPVKKPR